MHTIGKIAALSGVSTDTLRYYEKENLIKPTSKSNAGYRLYDEQLVSRIHFIKTAQHCGFTLSDIRELLSFKQTEHACCKEVRNMAIEKKLKIAQKIATLRTMLNALDELIAHCAGSDATISECSILSTLENSLDERPH